MITITQFIAAVQEKTGKQRSRFTIRQLCQSGTIQAKKIGRDWLIELTEVDRYIAEDMRKRG